MALLERTVLHLLLMIVVKLPVISEEVSNEALLVKVSQRDVVRGRVVKLNIGGTCRGLAAVGILGGFGNICAVLLLLLIEVEL